MHPQPYRPISFYKFGFYFCKNIQQVIGGFLFIIINKITFDSQAIHTATFSPIAPSTVYSDLSWPGQGDLAIAEGSGGDWL